MIHELWRNSLPALKLDIVVDGWTVIPSVAQITFSIDILIVFFMNTSHFVP